MLKAYSRDFHREDRLTWQAIFRNQTVRASDVWTQAEFQNSPFLHGFLQPHGLRYAMAAPDFHATYAGPGPHPMVDSIIGGWRLFAEHVDPDVVGTVSAVRSVERGELKYTIAKESLVIEMPLDVADMLLIDR